MFIGIGLTVHGMGKGAPAAPAIPGAMDTAAERFSVMGWPLPLVPGITPDVTLSDTWRRQLLNLPTVTP